MEIVGRRPRGIHEGSYGGAAKRATAAPQSQHALRPNPNCRILAPYYIQKLRILSKVRPGFGTNAHPA